jgi:hypothetical protein
VKILHASIIILVSCTVPVTKTQSVIRQIPKLDTAIVVQPFKADTIFKKDTVIYNDSVDSITTKHYKGLLTTIDQQYKRIKPTVQYRFIPLALFPYFCYKKELLPKDKPIIFFDSFKYNLMQLKLTSIGGELVAIASVSYIKKKNRPPEAMIYRLNFYEYGPASGVWRKSEYTTSIKFVRTRLGTYRLNGI